MFCIKMKQTENIIIQIGKKKRKLAPDSESSIYANALSFQMWMNF